LLLNASHAECAVLFEGKKIMLQPGQLITGRKSISDKFNISESKVQRVLNMLKIERQIEQQTTPRNRLITILNWSDYQNSEQQSEQQVNNKRTPSEQQLNTNKNIKNIKTVKKVKNINNNSDFCVLDDPLKTALNNFSEFREKIKAPLTDHAMELLIKRLNKLAHNDADKIEILEQSILNGWKGVFELKKSTKESDNAEKEVEKPDEFKLNIKYL
jgi:hypothetical protein